MRNNQSIAWKSLPGHDDTSRMVLPNGITVLVRSNFFSPSVVISGLISCGSLMDPPGKLGLAYFTSLALMRGNEKRSFQQIYDSLKSVGASLGFSGGMHSTSFSGRALAEDLPLILNLLGDSIRYPLFPEDQVERLRGQLLTGLTLRAQDTEQMASLTFDALLYQNHPYANPEDGYPDTIGLISAGEIRQFHSQTYGPKRMILTVVGAVEPDAVFALVNDTLGDWDYPDQPELPIVAPFPDLDQVRRKHITIPGKSQTDLDLGCFGPRRSAPDFMAASLGNSILGQFGMMGRIGEAVREKAGLAYQASTVLNAGYYGGEWEVIAGVNPVNLDKAIAIIVSELKRFVSELVTNEELEDSQANYIGRLPLLFESNMGVANSLLNTEKFQLGLDYYRRMPEIVRAVTSEDVLRAVQNYIHPEKWVIASAGPGNGGKS